MKKLLIKNLKELAQRRANFFEIGRAVSFACCLIVLLEKGALAQTDNETPLFLQYRGTTGDDSVLSLSKRGEHFAALRSYLEHQAETNLSDTLAAARSAWALGLTDLSRKLWDEALASPDLVGVERNKTLLAYAILELQEEHYDDARRIAEGAAQKLEPSELRSQFWLVVGEALSAQQAASLAEGYYQKALNEATPRLRSEALFLLGECQLRLGKRLEARKEFTAIEMPSEYTARALKHLIDIDLAEKNYQGVVVWVKEGRNRHPTDFREEDVTLQYVEALVALQQLPEADAELRDFRIRYSDASPWFEVMRATVESGRLQMLYPRARLSPPIADAVTPAKLSNGGKK